MEREAVPRVLIGDFGVIARLGLREFLRERGFEVVAEKEAADGIIDRLTSVRPDVVVLDLDTDSARGLAARITSDFPSIKVVICSVEEPTMWVFPPFHHGEYYTSALSPALLAEAIEG